MATGLVLKGGDVVGEGKDRGRGTVVDTWGSFAVLGLEEHLVLGFVSELNSLLTVSSTPGRTISS